MRLREIDQMILILLQGYNFRNRSEQQPASEEAINRLKEVEVSKEDYDNDNNGNPVPPNCAIWVDEMNDRAVRLRCKHMFHKECLVSWIKIHHVCPVWRVPVD